ncbi:MAG: ARMT1-like domain-containing protein [Candidatus Omnitrophota bacterium]
MKASYKCIDCFSRQIKISSSLIRLNKKDKESLVLFLRRKLLKFDFNQPPVVFGRAIYKSVAKAGGVKDIFAKEKIRIENYLIKLSPYFRMILEKAQDPLYAAARICCAANEIDFGAGKRPDLKNIFFKIKNIKLKINHFSVFKSKLKKIRNLLIIGDNSGEAFFDKFFIEEIIKFNPQINVCYATRSSPIINDVLISDAKRLALDKVARITSSGCDYPGIILEKISKSFRKIYNQADLIISKGQGNFESLSDKEKDIFYLFQIKCITVSDFLSLPVGGLLFIHNKNMAPEKSRPIIKKSRRS